MTLLYDDELQKTHIDSLNQNQKFTNPAYFEKFIMDFEMLHHISKHMNCIVRGGMGMPFHLDKKLKRLSTDIDIVVNKSPKELATIISSINLLEYNIKITPHPKSVRTNTLPLEIYDISHNSHYGRPGHVSLDIFCETIPQLESIPIKKGSEVLGFKTKEDIQIFDIGSLIADKLNTIAKNTIGYTSNIDKSTPKQVYDLGRLFDMFHVMIPNKPIEKFEEFSNYKSRFYNNPFSFEQIINSIKSHMEDLVDPANIDSLKGVAKTHHGNFGGQHLGQHGYSITSYIEDIFKIQLFCKYALQYVNKQITKNNFIKLFQTDLKESKDTDELTPGQQQNVRTNIAKQFPTHSKITSSLKQVPLRNLVLINKIESI